MYTGSDKNPDATTVRIFPDLNPEQIRLEVDKFMAITNLYTLEEYFIKGAFLAQDPEAFEGQRDVNIKLLPEEKEDLRLEKSSITRRWRLASNLWILLAVGAVIQGFDETAVNSGICITRTFKHTNLRV